MEHGEARVRIPLDAFWVYEEHLWPSWSKATDLSPDERHALRVLLFGGVGSNPTARIFFIFLFWLDEPRRFDFDRTEVGRVGFPFFSIDNFPFHAERPQGIHG